jgi:hypothetical protein
MASCAACGTTILFGGVRDGESRFCNAKCKAEGSLRLAIEEVPDALVSSRVWVIREGRCPECRGVGPVDLHCSYRVWSGLIIVMHSTRPHICCRRCGTRAQWRDAAFSFVLGWWSLWGVIWTPLQLYRNMRGILRSDGPSETTPQLELLVRAQLADDLRTHRLVWPPMPPR